MAVLRVAHVWGDRLLDVRHFAGVADRIVLDGEAIDVVPNQRIARGDTAVVFSWVEPTPRVKGEVTDRDWGFTKLVVCTVLLASASVAMFSLQAEFGFADRDDPIGRISPNLAKTAFVPPPKPKPTMLEATSKIEKTTPAAAAPSKAHAPLKAKNAGLLAALDGLKADALFAHGYSPGVMNALENLKGGGPAADAQGLTMGPRGFGPVGPGIGLGVGGPGTRGVPTGVPGGGLGPKVHVSPCCEIQKVGDGLDKDVVAKVIKRHFAEIKFCYEQQLQQHADLAGKVLVQFVIDPTGSVSDAAVAETTLENASVESCILSRIRRWKFPEPRGGGVVSITHPWFFKAAGAED